METTETTKPAGRPRKALTAPVKSAADTLLPKTEKKGKPARWKPGGRLAKLNVPNTHVGRWCSKDSVNIQQKLEEGWVLVNKTTAPGAKQVDHDAPDLAYDGKALESAVQFRDMVGMMLPIEDINGTGQCLKERQKYIAQQNDHAIRSRINLGKEKSRGGSDEWAASRANPTLTID